MSRVQGGGKGTGLGKDKQLGRKRFLDGREAPGLSPVGPTPSHPLPLQRLSRSSLPFLSSTLLPSDLESRSPCLLLPPSSSLSSLGSEAPLCEMPGLWEGVRTQAENSLWLRVFVRRGRCGAGQGHLVPPDSMELFLSPEMKTSLSS